MESRNANSSRIGCRSKLSRPVISKGEPSEKGRPSLEQIPSQLSKKSRLRKPPSETTFSDLTHYTTIKWNRSSSSQSASTQTLTINCPSGSEDEYALTGVKFSDKSKAFANNTYASSIDYYYTPATASYSKKLAQTGGWWSDLVDNNPPSGSIDGNYATSVTVHWVSGISYVNASCTTMTQMTLDYLVPFGIIVG